jgi:transposase
MQCLGLKSKNDKIDSIGLARMGAEQSLPRWNAPRKIIAELRDITRYREDLQESRTKFHNQLSAYLCGEFVNGSIVEGLESMIALLDQQIDETEKTIKEKLAEDEELQKGAKKLVAIKGLGIISVATILAETNCFDMFYKPTGQLRGLARCRFCFIAHAGIKSGICGKALAFNLYFMEKQRRL